MSLSSDKCIFINCPFDQSYKNGLLYPILFVTLDCGFNPRCTLDVSDSSCTRVENIIRIVRQCKYGIHDISETRPDNANHLPRFNMPLELGIFLGAKFFGSNDQRRKNCLVLDIEEFRYQKFCSDISGQDIKAHRNRADTAVNVIQNWLSTNTATGRLPSGSFIFRRYQLFRRDLPQLCKRWHLRVLELNHADYKRIMQSWISENA